MIRIVLYSDQPILAKQLKVLVQTDPTLALQACCTNILAVKEQLAAQLPDLLVIEVTPQITLSVLTELRRLTGECKVILWAQQMTTQFAGQALALGIQGILRSTHPLELHRKCLHKVYAGELWIEESFVARGVTQNDKLTWGRYEPSM